MSLSSHLESKSSPVRIWLEQRFPETRTVAREANRQLRRGAEECPLPRVPGADPGLVGTAVDYLLRACLRVTSIESSVASSAVQLLMADPSIDMRAIEVEREAVSDIKRLRPSSRDLTDDEWSELCIRCLVLARFEQFFRAGPLNPAILDLLILPLRQCKGLDDFIPLTLTPASIQDLEQLGRCAWEDARSLRRAQPLVLNPKFHLSVALGGADADLVARRRLIDWKATTKTGIVGRAELWQLVGYALADTYDEYEIREVSIAALRWRSAITWRLDDLLVDLAPGPPVNVKLLSRAEIERRPIDLVTLRQDFALVVVESRERHDAALAKMREQLPKKLRS